jgi:DNA-binding FrmR family transcriptional regulator
MEEIDNRMRRIIGQLRGIHNMVKTKRDCPDILQQISASKKAIDALSKEIILIYIQQDLPESKRKKVEDMIDKAINL